MPVNGQDACLVNLPGIISACCGHGVKEGSLVFANGVVIKGHFRIKQETEEQLHERIAGLHRQQSQ